MKYWKRFSLWFPIASAIWMISACAPYYNHTSLLMDYPAESPYPSAYFDGDYGAGPYDYPPSYYGDAFMYGNYYGGYGGYGGGYYNGGFGGGYSGSPYPSMPSHRMLR